jgi:hypothetical protein
MKAKKRRLTAATLSAFLALAGAVQAQNTGGDNATSGKKATKIHKYHRSGKKGHRSGKKGHKHRHRSTSTGTTPPK